MTLSLQPSRLEERTKIDNCLIKVIPGVINISDIYDVIGAITIEGDIIPFTLDNTDLYLNYGEIEIRIREVENSARNSKI